MAKLLIEIEHDRFRRIAFGPFGNHADRFFLELERPSRRSRRGLVWDLDIPPECQ